jgi:hypothetical protein
MSQALMTSPTPILCVELFVVLLQPALVVDAEPGAALGHWTGSNPDVFGHDPTFQGPLGRLA